MPYFIYVSISNMAGYGIGDIWKALVLSPFVVEQVTPHGAVCADLCASSATQSVACPPRINNVDSECPPLPRGASCTALAGMIILYPGLLRDVHVKPVAYDTHMTLQGFPMHTAAVIHIAIWLLLSLIQLLVSSTCGSRACRFLVNSGNGK